MTTNQPNKPEGGSRRRIRYAFLTAMGLLLLNLPAFSQNQTVTVSAGEIPLRRAISELEQQTGKKFAFSTAFDLERKVTFPDGSITLQRAAEIMTGEEFSFSFDGNHVLIYSKLQKQDDTPALRYISGLIRDDKTGKPLKNALVEIITDAGRITTRTDELGYFSVDNVPAGRYIAKIHPAEGGQPQYSEVVATTAKTRVEIAYKEYDPQISAVGTDGAVIIEDAESITETEPVTTYYFFEKEGDLTKANPRSSLILIPEGAIYSEYKPKLALKTNFLMWATTTPNIGLEFSLGRKWTLDLAYAYNPWHWDNQKSYRFWVVQPEVRYWFCNRFERHFIGLHGIYGQFNMGKFDWPFPDTFKDYRYKGYGYGAGLAYGYHLPIAKRWSLEFTVGAGWVHLDYDKYRCGSCDEHEGRKKTDYFGPTKAGINLIFFIK